MVNNALEMKEILNDQHRNITKQDLAIAVALVVLGFFSIFSYSTFYSKWGAIHFLNATYLMFILGFIVGLGVGNYIKSDEVRLRVFGVFIVVTSIFVFIRWRVHFYAHLPELGIGLILGVISFYAIYALRKDLWKKIGDGLIISIIAVLYLSYLIFFRSNAALDVKGFVVGLVPLFVSIIGYAVLMGVVQKVTTVALLGMASAGKTTFTCMCNSEKLDFFLDSMDFVDRQSGGKNKMIEARKEFEEDKLFPVSTPEVEWSLVIMERETRLTKDRVLYVDCSGAQQKKIFEDLQKKHFESDALKKVLGEYISDLGVEEQSMLMSKPISTDLCSILEKKGGMDLKIAFIKCIMDSDRLIILVDGGELREHHEDKKIQYLFDSMTYYASIIRSLKPRKVAIVVSKGDKFGVNDKNYNERIKTVRDYFNNSPGANQLIKAIKSVYNSDYEFFSVGVPSDGFICKKCNEDCDEGEKCPSCGEKPREKHASKIFGVKEVINWILGRWL
ncbi:sulfite exporter TauE/SafE family protein [candidate division WOR-3 bacterium]|nr:sulfite exporter TauE/SafE family protein [candidate division WOR-3 bacterium]